LNFTIKKLLMK